MKGGHGVSHARLESPVGGAFYHNYLKITGYTACCGLFIDKKGKPSLGLSNHRGLYVSELSRSEKMLAEKTVCVLLVRGEDPDGGPIYAYMGVRADKLKEFMEAQQKGLFYPEEHGVIIESGQGEPSAEVRTRMERDYGFNHEGMLDIPDSENADRVAAQLSKKANNKPD